MVWIIANTPALFWILFKSHPLSFSYTILFPHSPFLYVLTLVFQDCLLEVYLVFKAHLTYCILL